ncbi:MAG: lamin tail domain-containing protein, partial [Akkermansiaceae bacterium]|nr:lamin tail domain-containing protein [Akkermansiaceae bacterium]
ALVPDLFINEILTHSVIPQIDRIELHNPNPGDLDAGGWFLTDDLSQPEKFRLPEPTIVPGGGFLIFDENDFNPTPGIDPS